MSIFRNKEKYKERGFTYYNRSYIIEYQLRVILAKTAKFFLTPLPLYINPFLNLMT